MARYMKERPLFAPRVNLHGALIIIKTCGCFTDAQCSGMLLMVLAMRGASSRGEFFSQYQCIGPILSTRTENFWKLISSPKGGVFLLPFHSCYMHEPCSMIQRDGGKGDYIEFTPPMLGIWNTLLKVAHLRPSPCPCLLMHSFQRT